MGYEYLGFIALVVALMISRSAARKAYAQLPKEQHVKLVAFYKPWRTMLLVVLLSMVVLFYDKPMVFVATSIVMLLFYHGAVVVKFKKDNFSPQFRRQFLFSKVIFYVGVGVCLAAVAVGNSLR